MDNFSNYGTDYTLMKNGVYSIYDSLGSPVITTDPDGVSGGHVLQLRPVYGGNHNSCNVSKVLSTSPTVLGVALRAWVDSFWTGLLVYPCPITFQDGSLNFLYTIVIDSIGRLVVYSGGSHGYDGTQVGITSTPVVTTGSWYHIEAVYNSASALDIYVEGVNVLSIAVSGTAAQVVQMLNRPDPTSTGINMYIKDLFIWDGTGSHNNSQAGTIKVVNLTPDSDVSLNWTPSTGSTGYNILANDPPNDSDYISAGYSPIPSPYVCGLTDLPSNISSVRALMSMIRATKADGGDGSIQTGITSSGSTSLGVNRSITSSMTYWTDVFETDPNTGTSWLPAAVNAAELQINRTV
jgi:hypothetical protein